MQRPEPPKGLPPEHPASLRRPRLQIIDLAAMVVGYSLAAVLFRAFWPRSRVSPHLLAFASGFFLWLGMAMSGPLVLMKRRGEESGPPPGQPGSPAVADPRTWAEKAWLAIGVYWIVLGAIILPGRLHAFRFGDTILFGAVPLIASVAFRMFGTRRSIPPASTATWTHLAAVTLVATWPLAWFCLIVVGQAIL